jgi:hypothetical protein
LRGEWRDKGTPGEKRYKEKVNKKVDGQRKRKPEEKHKRESCYRKSTYKWKRQGAKREKKKERATGGIITEVKLGTERKATRKGRRRRMHGKKAHIDNK